MAQMYAQIFLSNLNQTDSLQQHNTCNALLLQTRLLYVQQLPSAQHNVQSAHDAAMLMQAQSTTQTKVITKIQQQDCITHLGTTP